MEERRPGRRSAASEAMTAIDVFRRVMKVFVVLGVLVSSTGICMMSYMWAYPQGFMKDVSPRVPFWLIIGGTLLAVLSGIFSQAASWWRRYQRNSMAQGKVRIDSSMGTSYDAEEGRSLIGGNVESTTTGAVAGWATSGGRASTSNFSSA